ncbi:MAG: hypothetical protein HY910_04305 [Desulfarculus sp.]|nr:hypothetical protein [Desulfarculus sp.]
MSADSNLNFQLQFVNQARESFSVFAVDIFVNNCQWISGEQPKVGQVFKTGDSALWGVAATIPNATASGEVRLKGSSGSTIGVQFNNLYNGIATVQVELSKGISYSIQSSSTGAQAYAKAIVTSGS